MHGIRFSLMPRINLKNEEQINGMVTKPIAHFMALFQALDIKQRCLFARLNVEIIGLVKSKIHMHAKSNPSMFFD